MCRIKFTLTDTLVDHPKEAALLGDFNNWNPKKDIMHKARNGFFEYTVEVPLGKVYQFRYLVDRWHWENDWQADDYAPTPFSEETNMVIICNGPDQSES